jgi:hypothetical protein
MQQSCKCARLVRTSKLVCLLVLALALPGFSSSMQLLSNPGFELGNVDWKSNGSGTATIKSGSGLGHGGSWYADLVASSGSHPVLFAANSSNVPIYFPVSPGNVVTFGGWAYRVSGNGSARYSIEVTDSNKANATWIQTSPSNVSTASWTQMSGTYTVPAGKAFIRFYPELFGATVTSEVRFDDASLVLTTNSTLTGFFNYGGSNMRLSQVVNETKLTTTNVNVNTFGKLFPLALDGWAFGQPLYAAKVSMKSGVHNVVYVATMHDSVYAFDADLQQAASPLWHRTFLNPNAGVNPVPMADVGEGTLYPEIGILSTPVIDPGSQTIYVVAATKEPGPTYVWRLHSLSMADGSERSGSPVVISATGFSARLHLNRSALMLLNGAVYVAFGSYQDIGAYHGWLFAYNAQTLQRIAVRNTTPTGSAGALWNSGSGPAADTAGNIFIATANGSFNAFSGGTNIGDSLVKLNLVNGNTLNIADYFTPFDQGKLDSDDNDFGSGGVLLLPDQPTTPTHVTVSGGKGGQIYVVNRDNMGHMHTSDNSQAVQVLPTGTTSLPPVFSSPAYWNGKVYLGPSGAPLRAYTVSSSKLTAASATAHWMGYPGVTPIVSANGTANGIVWVLERMGTSNNVELHAYNANNLASELYNSQQNATRDAIGMGTRFSVPLVYNGRVYVPRTNALTVFGPR